MGTMRIRGDPAKGNCEKFHQYIERRITMKVKG